MRMPLWARIAKRRIDYWWYTYFSCSIFPRQRWLKIPRTFMDVMTLIETTAFQSLVFYWEKDNGEATLRLQAECDWGELYEDAAQQRKDRQEVFDKMKAAYEFIKENDRPEYLCDLLEPELAALKDEHFNNIIKYRKHLWS